MSLSFGEKIKEARKTNKLTQKELAAKIGAKHNSVSDWENDKNKPDPDTIEILCGVLGITPNYLLATTSDEFSSIEKKIIESYRTLDSFGQETVRFILDRECARAKQLGNASSNNQAEKKTNIRHIQYYQRLASAGSGQFLFDGLPNDKVEAPDIPEYSNADYAVGVNGNSMSPDFKDGDTVLVEQTNVVEKGEVGIFIEDGEAFIKELGEGELISRNKDYPNIPLTHNTKCLGRVIGNLERSSEMENSIDIDAYSAKVIHDLLKDSKTEENVG